MSAMFYNCEKLEILNDDISNIDTTNITDLSFLFYGCKNLKSIPNLNWNTNKLENIKAMFYDCRSLKNIPDISNWNTTNINNMSYLFYG